MEKTILRLNKEVSIIILSCLVMIFTFMNYCSYITSFVSFLFVVLKTFIFIIVPLFIYVLEKQSGKFKKIAGVYTSYFIINLFVTIIASISMVNGVVPGLWKNLFDFVNLIILLSSLFILIEQILEYSGINSKVYSNTIMSLVYLVGNFISYPFLAFINKKIDKKEDSDE